ncbi:MAG: sigma-54 dependent transcriptional regulator, acetoin dehydrogenase operon transcriptional [Mycobacterium sp.]|jgi:transcriptional regulator of acetoin/glycerol metabolism|nr:sigma-54 dependent transcriptional regulator, acetoin dehydrogenase operon transcriptional [Mycobacterium sp.]
MVEQPLGVRHVRRARERFLSDHDLDQAVRESISVSWRRSRALNVPADRLDLPFVREPNLDSPLVDAADPVLRQLAEGLVDEPISVVLTSADGVVLRRIAADGQLNRVLDRVNLAPGYSYSEEFAGTNGIGTTLETRQPTLVRGAEHYAECLGELACAGVPIVHPVSGALVGALDLTGWVDDGGPLLATLAKSASDQIEGRLLARASAKETALLNAYLRACRRSPQSKVLAMGDDVVLMNRRLRWALDVQDQAALLEHAADFGQQGRTGGHLLAPLPSGQSARISFTDDFADQQPTQMAVCHVHLLDAQVSHIIPARQAVDQLPGIAGNSSSWRRSCSVISRYVGERQWVAVSGEPGSGRYAVLKAAAALYIKRPTRVLTPADFQNGAHALEAFAAELDENGFSIIIRDVDLLDESVQAAVAELCQGREDGGWLGLTTGAAEHDPLARTPVLTFVGQTVPVPALRHRIEDVHDLVPLLLRQLSRGSDLRLSDAATRQLCKYSWPGNVDELKDVLREVVGRQRTGVVDVHQLPPRCRTLSRHTLTQIEALERDAIVRSLEATNGSKLDAAAALGISRATIYRKIKEFGIDV